MKEITVHNQKQFDALPKSFKELTYIYIKDTTETIYVNFDRGSSHVIARGSSHVEARGSSHVEARESSHVIAWGSSHVIARESSHVIARESSHVEAWGSVSTVMQSTDAVVTLFMYAVCMVISVGKVIKKAKTATIIHPKSPKGTNGWLISQAIKPEKKVIVYKRVSKDFKTQEGTKNEFLYKIGSTVVVNPWTPKNGECGEGKLHACSRPFFCDEFRDESTDVYIAIQVDKKDLYAWPDPSYPHKIAFRRGKVLYQCDRYGEKL